MGSTSLDFLLGWDGNLSQKIELPIERHGKPFITVTLSSMTGEEQTKYEKQATSHVRTRTGVETELDEVKLVKLHILNHVIDPNLKDPQLLSKFGCDVNNPIPIVDKVFLPGEQVKIASAILRLSGFSNINEMDDELANLLENSKNA